MIEKLALSLKRENIEYSQLLGDMTQPARAKALERFQFDDEVNKTKQKNIIVWLIAVLCCLVGCLFVCFSMTIQNCD